LAFEFPRESMNEARGFVPHAQHLLIAPRRKSSNP
jgi:hypothetical protein